AESEPHALLYEPKWFAKIENPSDATTQTSTASTDPVVTIGRRPDSTSGPTRRMPEKTTSRAATMSGHCAIDQAVVTRLLASTAFPIQREIWGPRTMTPRQRPNPSAPYPIIESAARRLRAYPRCSSSPNARFRPQITFTAAPVNDHSAITV